MTDNNSSTLTIYATAFLASISMFGLVDAARLDEGGMATGAVTHAFLLPVLGIAAGTFLAVTLIALSRRHLRRSYRWNDPRTERMVLDLGLAATCYFGVLAVLGYFFALIAPNQTAGIAEAMARQWPWFLAVPLLAIGAAARQHKAAWLVAGAVFATIGLFT